MLNSAENAELRIVVGTVESRFGDTNVKACIHVGVDGTGFVALTMHEGRKDLFAVVGQDGWEALKELIANTDRTLAELRHTGKLLTMDG